MKNKFRAINKWNNLFVYFFATQILFFVTPFFARAPLLIDIDINPALQTHAFALVAFAIGYVISVLVNLPKQKQRTTRAQNEEGPQWIFKPQFFTGAYILMYFGIFIVILQIAIIQNPLEYLRGLLGGDFNSNVRNAFLLSSEEGGLKGIFKIFGTAPLSAYLFSLSVPHFITLTPTDQKRFSKLNMIALGVTALKILFSLDRLTIITIIMANVFMTARTRKNLSIKIALVVLFALLIEFVSRRRQQDVGGLDFIILYFNLGIVNLQLLLSTLQNYTFGFSSILAPLTFIYTPDLDLNPEHAKYYVDAQYLVGYVYMDFAKYFPLFFAALGYVYRTLDRKVLHEKNLYYSSIYFLIIGLTMTYAAVPAAKSVDFWFGVLMPLCLIKLYVRHSRQESATAAPPPGVWVPQSARAAAPPTLPPQPPRL